MKKFLPIILFLVGLLVIAGAFIVIKNRNTTKNTGTDDEGQLANIPLEKRPAVSLTPRENGHWLDLKVQKISIKDADVMEYMLLYTIDDPDGGKREQGVPGQVKLSGREIVEAPLLLGSESKGVYRYDEGVKSGNVTLRFRNKDGKLLAKFVSNFTMDMKVNTISSSDGKFKVTLSKPTEATLVAMNTVGYPGKEPAKVSGEPYGLFSTDANLSGGSVELTGGTLYRYTGSDWTKDVGGDSFKPGFFITTQQLQAFTSNI